MMVATLMVITLSLSLFVGILFARTRDLNERLSALEGATAWRQDLGRIKAGWDKCERDLDDIKRRESV